MILMISHRVRDYDEWKLGFDEHRPVREQHGATGHALYRPADDPNTVVIFIDFPTEQRVREFLADSSLKQVMEAAGVEGEPTISLLAGESVHYSCGVA